MQFKDSLGTPLLHQMETCTEELHEKKLIKESESSNCCIWSPQSDMAPMYAIEIAKLWLKQNCKNAAESLRHKMSNVKQRNEQQIRGISVTASEEEAVQRPQFKDTDVMTPREKVMHCHQMKDIGVVTSGKGVTLCQQINDISIMTSKEKVTQSQKMEDIGVMTSSQKVTQCQKINDVDVVTSGKRVTWCQQIKDIGVMTSKEKVTKSQQINDIGVMTSGEKFTHCQQIHDIGVMTSGERFTHCQQIHDIGVMTSGEKFTQSQQIHDIGVMTSGEKFTQCHQIHDIGVMTSGEKFTQCQQIQDISVMASRGKVTSCQQIKDIGVMTSGEKVKQCMQKSFSDEYASHRIMAVDAPGGYETPSIVTQLPKCSNTDHILKSSNMISNQQCTVKENVNRLISFPCPLEGREKQIGIYPPNTNGNIDMMNGSEVKNSCASKYAAFSASEPSILKNTINKHYFHEYNSSDKKYLITSEKVQFQNVRSCEKWCGDANPVVCNVMHKLPLEGSCKSSYSRILSCEGGLPHEKVDSKNLCVPELLHENNTHDTTQMSGNCGISLSKTALSEQFDSRCETKDQYQITSSSVHKKQENSTLEAIHTSNMKVNKSNYYTNAVLDPPVNVSPEMYCNGDSEIAKRHDPINILESKGNLLEFPIMDRYFTYNLEAQNVGPWVQEPPQKIGSNGYDTTLRMKSYETANTSKKLKRGHVHNEIQDEANVCGHGGIKAIEQTNNSVHLKKRNKSDERITMNGIRLTFTDTQAEDENTKKFTKRNCILSFFQNLLKTLDWSRNREKQSVYNKSSTFLTLSFKKHKSRKLKRQTHGYHEKHYTTRTSGYDRRTTLAEKEKSCNYSSETLTSTDKMPSSSSQENVDNSYKTHSLTHPVLQNVCQAFTSNMEQPKSLDSHDKMKHSVIGNKQLKLDHRTNSYRKQSSKANNYTSPKANRQVHDSSRRKENKYYGQPQICKNRQEAVNLLQDCKQSEDILNRNVKVPALFQDETATPPLNTNESDKNIVVMVAEVHSSSVVVNPDIMEELRQQRQDINSLKKMLANKEKKVQNTSYFKNTRKSKPQHKNDIPSEFVMPTIPDYNKNIVKFQTASDKQNGIGVTETPLPEQMLNQKCDSLSLQDYFAFNSVRFQNRGQAPDLTANHHGDICYDCEDEYTWRKNMRHSQRRAERKHLRYMIRHCRNYRTNFWNKILSFFR